jgi:4-aminobutyrate---pyruvate transaminase
MDSPTGHPVAAAVARETIAILHDNNIPGHVRTTSRTLLAGLDPLRGKDGVIDVRGHGLPGRSHVRTAAPIAGR